MNEVTGGIEKAVRHVVSAMLVNARGEVLLQQRDMKHDLVYPGMWTLFGGAVEYGETPDEAIRREIIEELELDMDFEHWTTYICPARSMGDVICYNHIYVGRLTVPVTTLILNEGQAMALFDREKAQGVELAFEQSPWLQKFFEAVGRDTMETANLVIQPQHRAGVEAVTAMFVKAKSENRAAFLPFAMIGYPSIDESIETIERMAQLGVDGFEIGVPFSDPLADGPVIQQASQVALNNGVTVETGLQAIRELRSRGVKQPMFLFSYLNPLLAYGQERFAQALQDAGGDGLLCPDLPPEEAHLFADVQRRNLALAFFLAPTSNAQRMVEVAQAATGFIYVVSVTGITGARRELPPDLQAYIWRIRQVTDKPLVLGFGISTPEQATLMHGLLDGFIVASALIRTAPQGIDAVVDLARSLAEAR